MTAKQFLDLLATHSDKELLFEYADEQFIPKNYHITEVKNVLIESVDCGGRPHTFRQTIVQLWISNKEKPKEQAMLAGKALKIFDKVNATTPIHGKTEILFEWGSDTLRTSNYGVTKVIHSENAITLQLFVPATACKPKLNLATVKAVSKSCC